MEHTFSKKEKEFTAQLLEEAPGLLDEHPFRLFVSELQSHNNLVHPLAFSTEQLQRFSQFKTKYGISAIALYQKVVLSHLIQDFMSKLHEKKLPAAIIALYNLWFERIYEDFATQPDFYYDIENELRPITHDLAICSGRTIPVGGAWFIEQRLLPRMLMTLNTQEYLQNVDQYTNPSRGSLHKPLAKFLKRLGLFTTIMKLFASSPKLIGGSWCYIIHTADRNIKDFTQESMELAYKNITALLQIDKSIWGVFRESWFLDPALKEISPNLTFLWETPLRKGARLYHGGPCREWDLKRALLLSPVRNKLYKEGKYIPRTYFYFWPRQKIIESYLDM
jgi:hypothetical protein